MTLTDHYTALVRRLEQRAIDGDEEPARTLGAMALLIGGWRPGDPDPTNPSGPDGGELIDLAMWKRAA